MKTILYIGVLLFTSIIFSQQTASLLLSDCREKEYNNASTDSIFLYKDSKILHTATHTGGMTIENLDPGDYHFEYLTYFGKRKSKSFKIRSEIVLLEGCVDSLDYASARDKDLFFDKLQDGEQIIISMQFSGCFASGKDSLIISKENQQLFLRHKGRKRKIKPKQLEALKRFELEIRNLRPSSSVCTTTVINQIAYLDKEVHYVEKCEGWEGFFFLREFLKLK